MDSLPNPQWVGGIDFEVASLDSAVERACEEALCRRSCHLHFANAWSVVLANRDNQLCEAFGSGRNYPDGKPVVWAMRWLAGDARSAQPSRVDGPTFFERVLKDGVPEHLRHYFLGSTPDTLEKLEANARRRFPGIDIAGVSSPPFRELTPEDIAEELKKIVASEPHVVWVGLGTPKQDKMAALLAQRYDAVFACVGAAFDYTAGNLRQAPHWVQNAGLGWLYRFIQEPRRLWRRYMIGNAQFIGIVFSQFVAERLTPRLAALQARRE